MNHKVITIKTIHTPTTQNKLTQDMIIENLKKIMSEKKKIIITKKARIKNS